MRIAAQLLCLIVCGLVSAASADESLAPQVVIQGFVAQKSVTPNYPKKALKKQQEGRVTVQFSVNQHGKAEAITIFRAIPAGVFERSAISAIKSSRFQPVAMRVTQTFIFSLSGEIKPPPIPSIIGKSILTALHNGHH